MGSFWIFFSGIGYCGGLLGEIMKFDSKMAFWVFIAMHNYSSTMMLILDL